MTILAHAQGTQTATITTEHVLSSPNVVGKFLLMVSYTNHAAGDRTEVRWKKKLLTGGAAVAQLIDVRENVQPADDLFFMSGWIPNELTDSAAVSFTLKQTFGTGRAFDWVVFRETDQADVTKWNGTAVPSPDTAGYPKVTIKDGTGTGELDTTSGKVALKDASFGTATLDGTFTYVAAADIAAAVGDLALASHTDPGSLGLALQDIDIAAAAVKVKTDQIAFSTANRVDSQVFGIQPSVITAATINTDAITASKIASGAIDADALAADAGTEIGTAVWAATTRLLTAGTNIALAKGTGVTGFNDLSAAQVNAEVLDVLATDTFAEPGAVPAATSSLKDMLHWLFTLARNKRTQTATTQIIRNDADNATIGTSTVSDDGTTLTVNKPT